MWYLNKLWEVLPLEAQNLNLPLIWLLVLAFQIVMCSDTQHSAAIELLSRASWAPSGEL